ncbi:hypothetical protein ACX818_001423 [Acinetobacter baumannii]
MNKVQLLRIECHLLVKVDQQKVLIKSTETRIKRLRKNISKLNRYIDASARNRGHYRVLVEKYNEELKKLCKIQSIQNYEMWALSKTICRLRAKRKGDMTTKNVDWILTQYIKDSIGA